MNITKGVNAKAQKVVLYGTEGIGKSSLAAQFPDPLFIDTEGSTNNMDVARMDKPTSWEFLNQQIDWVKNNKPCKTLIIDTFDWAEHLGIQFVTARGKKSSITSFGYGEGFIQLEEEVGKLLNKLSDVIEAGIHVVLTAHAKIVRFEAPDEMGAYDRYELKLGNKTTAKTASLVKEWADMVLFLNYKTFSVATDDKGTKFKGQGGARTMYAVHHPAWDAKNRHGLPDEMPMDYNQIAHIFNETVVQQAQQVTTPPQQQQAVVETPQTQEPQALTQQEIDSIPEAVETGQAPDLTGVPKDLQDLMILHNVTKQEIQLVVSQRGYYPIDTPIENYDPAFVSGSLVGAWDAVHGLILNERENSPIQ